MIVLAAQRVLRRAEGNTVVSYSTSDLRKGLKVLIDNEPYLIVDTEFMKPGKGQAVYRTKMKNLLRGTIVDKTYRSGDKVDAADVTEASLEYLYNDSREWTFMNPENYEQISVSKDNLEDAHKWLKEGMPVGVVFWGEKPISVVPPNHVELEVTYCESVAKGNTASNVQKPATLETGAEVNVPAFINIGDKVKIDTRTGEYVERVRG
jgi:elongation factor P